MSRNYPTDHCVRVGIHKLKEAGKQFHERGWSFATSSNYSIVIDTDPINLLMTASGKDKSSLYDGDFVIVDSNCLLIAAASSLGDLEQLRPSAETALHIAIATLWEANCILHTHSVASTVLSEKFAKEGFIRLENLEMLKALQGITSHACAVDIPIFPNNQDIDLLARIVREQKDTISHAFILQGHGLYTWGTTFEEAKRHVEALEFMFEVKLRLEGL